MSDLQCPARLRLVSGVAPGGCRLGDDPMGDLLALADLHRGEDVVVGVPPIAAAALPGALRPAPGADVHVEVDADGWRVVRP